MGKQQCQRYAELTDREALGEGLAVQDQQFRSKHPRECAACAREAELYSSLSSCLDEERFSQKVRRERFHGGRWIGPLTIATGGVLAVAAGVLLLWWILGTEVQPSEQSPSEAQVDLVLVAGKVEVGGTPAAAGASLRPRDMVEVDQGRACLSYERGTTACVDHGSRLEVLEGPRTEQRLRLVSGRVVCRLDQHSQKTRFAIETRWGSVTAKGTVFAVEKRNNEAILVRLHRGRVEVKTKDGRTEHLQAPAAVRFAEDVERVPAQGEAWDEDLSVIGAADLWTKGAVALLDVSAEPVEGQVLLDGVTLGETPVSALPGRGKHELAVRSSGYASFEEDLVVLGAERVSRVVQLEERDKRKEGAVAAGNELAEKAPETGRSAEAPSTGNSGSARPRTAAELLSAAQELRGSGRFAAAGKAYERLLRLHPKSSEASASLLSLGELQLGPLGEPQSALRSFESYLRRGGPLAQEASFGQIRALRRLGRHQKARRLTRQFLRDYPKSAQAASLRSDERTDHFESAPRHHSGKHQK